MFKLIYLKLYFFIFGGTKYARKIGVKVGSNARILTNKFGSEPFLITLGNNVTLTGGVRIITHDGAASLILTKSGKRYFKYSSVSIGSNVFVGVDTLIMPGVTIGDNVIVAAASVVTKDIPSNTVYGGIPASKICSFDDYKNKILKSGCTSDDFDIKSKTDIMRMAKITDSKRINIQ
ncbi:acyltransferase [Shewanella basaltis]|uniref:acyltransferase n=1 Tax=Shewanella basaltis TaxID=472183 RepID=UPI00200BB428|nr:acyltransferase [Shewanella basaltis]MCL1112988.1 acyltransferase [Shewanella basaltis]